MSTDDFDEFYVHTAKVETFLGDGSNGPVFAAPVILSPYDVEPNGVFADGARKLVLNAKGDQEISETTLYTSISNASLFTANTRVTLINDPDSADLTPQRPARVIKVNANDSGALDLPDHVVVSLT